MTFILAGGIGWALIYGGGILVMAGFWLLGRN